MDISDSKLDKIRNLLARASDERGATPEERELAGQKAAEMMAKYAVDEAVLDAHGREREDPMESLSLLIDTAYQKPKRYLLNSISMNLHCRALLTHDGAFVYGRKSDLERVNFLYTSLLAQAVSLAMRQSSRYGASQTRSLRGNYLLGFTVRIDERMKAGKEEAVRETTGAELVLKSRFDQADAEMRKNHPETRTLTRSRVTNEAGFLAGHAAGGRADMGQARVNGRRAINA